MDLEQPKIALNGISNNIANAKNPKYCKRSPVLASEPLDHENRKGRIIQAY